MKNHHHHETTASRAHQQSKIINFIMNENHQEHINNPKTHKFNKEHQQQHQN
jgi:hypothetical protein